MHSTFEAHDDMITTPNFNTQRQQKKIINKWHSIPPISVLSEAEDQPMAQHSSCIVHKGGVTNTGVQ